MLLIFDHDLHGDLLMRRCHELFVLAHIEYRIPVGSPVHAPHERVASSHIGESIGGVGICMEHIQHVAVLVLAPHAMTGAKLHLAVERSGLLNRIIEHIPVIRIGQVGVLIGDGKTCGVGLSNGRTGEDEIRLAIADHHVGAFGNGDVPRVFRSDDAHGRRGETRRIRRIDGGDVRCAKLLPCVVALAACHEIRHIEAHADIALRIGGERLAVGAQNRDGLLPVGSIGRVEIVSVGVLLELHVHRMAIRPGITVAGHEQNGQSAVDGVNFRSPEAVHDGVAVRIGVTGLEQRVFLGVVSLGAAGVGDQSVRVAGGVGERFDGIGHAERHVRRTRLPGAITVDVVGGDHQELGFGHFLAVDQMRPFPFLHGWIGSVFREGNLVFGLFDGAGGFVRSRFGGVDFGEIPVLDGQRAGRAVRIGELRLVDACQCGFDLGFGGVLLHRDFLGGGGHLGVRDASEAHLELVGHGFGHGDGRSGTEIVDAFHRGRVHGVSVGRGSDDGVSEFRVLAVERCRRGVFGHRVVVLPGDDVVAARGIPCDAWIVHAVRFAEVDDGTGVFRFIVGEQVLGCRHEDASGGFGHVGSAIGAYRHHAEFAVLQVEEARILDAARAVHGVHVLGLRGGAACEEDAVVFVVWRVCAVVAAQREVHAMRDVAVVGFVFRGRVAVIRRDHL